MCIVGFAICNMKKLDKKVCNVIFIDDVELRVVIK